MKLRIFRSVFSLLFFCFLVGIYFINPNLMSWSLFITALIIYVVLDFIISFVIAKDRSEEDPKEFGR